MAAKRRVVKKNFFKKIKPELFSRLIYSLGFLLALLYWEILLKFQTGFDGAKFFFLLFLPAEAIFLSMLTGWFSKRTNRIITPIIMLIPFAFYVSQLIYHRIFGSLISVSMMGLGAAAVENFGWALIDTVKDSVGWIILCLLPVIASILSSVFLPNGFFKKYRPLLHFTATLKTVLLWFLAVLMLLPFGTNDFSPYYAYSSSYIDTDTASNRLGVLTNSLVELGHKLSGKPKQEEVPVVVAPEEPDVWQVDMSENVIDGLDFNKLKEQTNDKEKQNLCDYFANISGTNKNDKTGLLKDYNLIYICAESFSKYAIDPVVTPTLYKLSQGGIVLNNFYNSYKNTTTNGEYTFMTGLWPDVSRDADAGTAAGSFPQSKNKSIPFALGNMFEGVGISTYAYHNYRGYYYSRNETHPNLGYTTTRFMDGQNGMTFTTTWPSSDLEMMEQSVDDFINNDRFHTYYMTFSGHGPYSAANPICVKNIETIKELTKDRELSASAEYYLAANYELELAMKYLLERLEQAGKLNNTLIVIAGDHYPYYLNDEGIESLAGKKLESNFEAYQSSCIMWCGGIEPIVVDTPCCNVDILPTVLNLFDCQYDSRLLPGVDIFSNNTHIAMLYNKSFVTDFVKYNAPTGKTEWLSAADNMPESEKEKHLEYCISITKSRYTVSLQLMDEDFYKFVFDNLPKTEETVSETMSSSEVE